MEPPQRQTHARDISYASHRSDTSGGSKPKSNLESPKDKDSNKIRSHADPTVGLSEAQPASIALESSTLESLRSMQHKDRHGVPIVEPDLSNPTRHRFERPLETIRAFEAAIEGTYSTRRLSTAARLADESPNGHSRPTSYFGDRANYGYPGRSTTDFNGYNGYPGNRGYQSRPESYVDMQGGPYSQQSYSNQQQYQTPRRHGARGNPDHQWNRQHSPGSHPHQGHYPHADNGFASSPSASAGPSQWANSTDPSSVNSSLDRLQQQIHQQKMEQQQQQHHPQQAAEAYGFAGFGNSPELDHAPPSFQDYSLAPREQPGLPDQAHLNGYNAASGVPPKDASAPVAASGKLLQKNTAPTPAGEKRKSWFKRRFSKS